MALMQGKDMKSIRVSIEQIDKKGKKLSVANLKDQIANVLYRDTVVSSARIDQIFYILMYFAVGRTKDGRSLAEIVFDEAIPKLESLNKQFTALGRRLYTGEYSALKENADLGNILKYDLFFVLYEGIEHLPEIREKYADFIESQPGLKEVIGILEVKYRDRLRRAMNTFISSEIEDEREDENGNILDHSKSVYRTVQMRNARNLNLNLQQYTDVRKIRSESPILVELLQYIDPQMVIDLWEKYHVAEYASYFVQDLASRISLPDRINFSEDIGLAELLAIHFARENQGNKEKRKGLTLELAKAKKAPAAKEALENMAFGTTKSVLNVAHHLTEVISAYRKKLIRLEHQPLEFQDKDQIERLREQIEQLENLRVQAEISED